jgi:hypothetical protein
MGLRGVSDSLIWGMIDPSPLHKLETVQNQPVQREWKMGCARLTIICIRGPLKSEWSDWFSGLSLQVLPGCSLLTGLLPDQSALMGVLDAIHNLGLTLISVNTLEIHPSEIEVLSQGATR